MKFIRQQFLYILKNLLNVKMLIAMLMVVLWSFLYVQDYITLAETMDNDINVLEPAIYLLSNSSISAFLFVLCFVFSFCDIPFEDGSLPYYVYRSGHKRWYLNLLIFTIVFCLLFLILPVLISCLLGATKGYFSFEVWSQVARLTANGGAPQMPFLPVFSPMLMYYSPGEALFNSLILTFLHYFIIAGLLQVFNSCVKKTWGVGIVTGGEIAGFMLVTNFPKAARCFPFINASLSELTFREISKELSSAPYVWEVCIWFCVLSILTSIAGYITLKRYKFELGEEK